MTPEHQDLELPTPFSLVGGISGEGQAWVSVGMDGFHLLTYYGAWAADAPRSPELRERVEKLWQKLRDQHLSAELPSAKELWGKMGKTLYIRSYQSPLNTLTILPRALADISRYAIKAAQNGQINITFFVTGDRLEELIEALGEQLTKKGYHFTHAQSPSQKSGAIMCSIWWAAPSFSLGDVVVAEEQP